MGFSGGKAIAEALMHAMMDCAEFTPHVREYLYRAMIPAIEAQDCDTLEELLGCDDSFDAVMSDLRNPPPEGFSTDEYRALRKEIGKYLCSEEFPLGVVFEYDMGEKGGMFEVSYTFETFEQLLGAAADYRNEMDGNE
jgi:hypothetical protein